MIGMITKESGITPVVDLALPLYATVANHRTEDGEEVGVVTRIWAEADYRAVMGGVNAEL